MNSFARFVTESLAASLLRGLRLELFLTPKPGLVDLLDRGSHPDLSVPRMLASIDMVADYFAQHTVALSRGASLPELIGIGRSAEERLLARFGTNTHKGAIFLGGILLAARFRTPGGGLSALSRAVGDTAAEFFTFTSPGGTNGAAARREHRITGIIGEASAGLPALFDGALPAYRETLARSGDHHFAAFAMLASLMQSVEDTTTIHRGGPAGLASLRRDGERLERVLRDGNDPCPLLSALNAQYTRENLTMGGVADLLGMGFGILNEEGIIIADRANPPLSLFSSKGEAISLSKRIAL